MPRHYSTRDFFRQMPNVLIARYFQGQGLSIRLDPGCETPAARSFTRPDLVREVLRERGRYVSAALTIVRAWIVAGRPKTACRSLAGYGDWSDLCRQPLLWLNYADPSVSVFLSIKIIP